MKLGKDLKNSLPKKMAPLNFDTIQVY